MLFFFKRRAYNHRLTSLSFLFSFPPCCAFVRLVPCFLFFPLFFSIIFFTTAIRFLRLACRSQECTAQPSHSQGIEITLWTHELTTQRHPVARFATLATPPSPMQNMQRTHAYKETDITNALPHAFICFRNCKTFSHFREYRCCTDKSLIYIPIKCMCI